MRKTILSIAVVLFAFSSTVSSQITIDDCYRMANDNYPMIRQYELIRQSESYTLSNAAKGYLPQIALSAKVTYQSEVTKMPFSSDIVPGLKIDPLSKDQYQATVEVTQSVWDGGMIRSQQEITRRSSEVETKRADVELYALRDRVNQLYFSILLFDEQLSLNTIMQNDLNIQIEKVSRYIEGGIANNVDLDIIKVNLLALKQQAIELQKNREAYIQMLSAVVGKTIDQSLVMPQADAPSLPTTVERPELALFNAQSALTDGQRAAITAKNRPKFNLFVQGGYGKPGFNMLKNEFQPFYIGGIRLAWNFGSLYTRKGEMRLLDTQQSQIEVQRDLFLYNTNQQQLKSYNEIGKYTMLMADDDEVIRLRGNIRQSSEAKTEAGTLSVADMMRDINAEQQAKQNKVLHKVQSLMSIYSLKYITNNP